MDNFLLFGIVPEIAGHTKKQIQEWSDELTEDQIQWLVDRYMAYANHWNCKIVKAQSESDAAESPLLKFYRECCEAWTKEATLWAIAK